MKGNLTEQILKIVLPAVGIVLWTGIVVLFSFIALKVVRF